MEILLSELYVTQKSLRRKEQVPKLVAAIQDDRLMEPVILSQQDDGSIQIEDGHPRCTAYIKSGRLELQDGEFKLVMGDNFRPRFGKLPDLIRRHGFRISAYKLI